MNVVKVGLPLMLVFAFAVSARGQQDIRAVRERAKSYEPIIIAAARHYEIDARLLWTLAYLESRFRSNAVSYKDGRPCARGLMQFIASTAQRYGLKDPHDGAASIQSAAHYVRDLQARFGPRRDLILAAYNAGEGTVEAFRDGKKLVLSSGKVINPNSLRTDGIPPYQETRDYVANGRAVYEQISREELYARSPQSNESLTNSRQRQTQRSFYWLSDESHPSQRIGRQDSTSSQSIYPN